MTRFSLLLASSALALTTAANAQNVDPNLPVYEAASGVSGNLTSIGSDTLNNLMTLWSEGFRSFYPNVAVQIQGAGSGTAPPALVEGTAQFGPMSRPMRGTEIEEFEARYGYEPLPMRGAIDAIGVFVHRDNPVTCVSMQEIDAIFSSTRAGGADAPITTWGELGATGEWADRSISTYGRNSASGTYGYFREVALFGGDYSPDVREQPGSSTVIQGVASDIGGIGYSGVGYGTADVRALEIRGEDGTCYTTEDAPEGTYPIARFLYVYMNVDPNAELEPLRAEFVRYVYSQQGQQDVVRAGFFPVTARIADLDLEAFGLN
ncbi:PstS family phosphate ABC transporter substrate-binding protein [Roseinatronobacter bogoriensis]|uniref:Phosphate-binding protein n=1 Tax=Roseinatronobacter bogoriensis subsp. barguzinensis TaxID=441209 RepID=A0A2K8KC84_9RHOB|nr:MULTISPECIES: phosphate ABC transporter substrate-binding protein PstS family protein [Rhodobaca]ATX67034.1 phosphate-binding protein [Rhodobaca barguzinensis]MBB4206539.1 phosphate transport system substrate-binding protein [Rhodobaca bogoriensis DSM 18756]TDW41282.1 phosphate transport system substrate-binding protein [Rhodobaca barguzinensis]TDY74540.1 phosphate ABC transporter substrate-binding protein (PhoT family) [Rhodobaca bogoriensis DSM 18756]